MSPLNPENIALGRVAGPFAEGEAPHTGDDATAAHSDAQTGPSRFLISYFDLEVRKNPDEIGWDEVIRSGGVSIAAILEEFRPLPRFFDDHTLEDGAAWLENAGVVVTFNGKRFDIPLIENHLGRNLQLKEHIDIFVLVKEALSRVNKPWKGHGLDALCMHSFHEGKTGRGDLAPHLARNGRWAELISYCLNDVRLTRKLCDFIRWNGYVIDADGDMLYLDIPKWFRLRDYEQREGK